MGELDRIRNFLGAVRRRSLLRDAVFRLALGGSVMLVALLALAAAAGTLGPATFWRPVTLVTLAIATIATAVAALFFPMRALRTDHRAARLVGRLHPPLASDIVSVVELAAVKDDSAPAGTGSGSVSPALVHAFQGQVAAEIQPLDPARLVPMRPAARGLLALLLAAAALIAAARLAPGLVGRGLGTLLHRPSRFEGAAVSAAPIVGEVRIIYQYPAYTGLPARTVEGSTGDVVAVKGTRVKIETRPLRTSRKAALLLGEAGEVGELPATVHKGQLSAELTLLESGSYRFWLQPLIGRAVREQRSHRLEAEVDRPPRVEIHGPADRLELPTPRPIEVGFAADDDYGLGAVDLVYRIGDAPEQRTLLKQAHGARVAQGRTLWDPAREGLTAGVRVAYRIEARDRDEVSGAKAGTSRTLYLVIARPQESIDDRLDRQRQVMEALVGDLADRLEARGARAAAAAAAAAAGGGAGTAAGATAPAHRHAAYVAVHEAEESHLALLGQLLDTDRRDSTLGKALRATLLGISDRLGKLLREEREALATTTGAAATGSSEKALATAATRLDAMAPRHIAELERDVLLLDDLIGRQRLDDLAALGRELSDTHRRLEDLLSRYAATKDEALRRQLEREVRELRARIADLAAKIASLKNRNDVPEEWRNLPDTKQLAERAKKLDELLAQGDPDALSKALSELGQDLRSLRQMLDENAERFGADRFPQENRVISELMKKIGELEGDERALAGETQGLSEKQQAETEKRLRNQMAEWMRKEREKVEKLRKKLGDVKTGDPESALSEEVERAREGARQIERLLAERDLAEAKAEADRAAASMDRALEHLEEGTAPGTRKRKRPADQQRAEAAAEGVGQARQMAQEIAEDIRQLLPRGEETLSSEEKERARAQADRQSAIGERTEETAREAARRLGKMPGLERAESELRGAAEQMRQAASDLRKSDAKQAAGAQRNAAERLAKLRDSMQERSTGGSNQHRDPVRIPGADDSSAPRAWRQELLDAMKEKAPERFRDDVRRYYEDLVR